MTTFRLRFSRSGCTREQWQAIPDGYRAATTDPTGRRVRRLPLPEAAEQVRRWLSTDLNELVTCEHEAGADAYLRVDGRPLAVLGTDGRARSMCRTMDPIRLQSMYEAASLSSAAGDVGPVAFRNAVLDMALRRCCAIVLSPQGEYSSTYDYTLSVPIHISPPDETMLVCPPSYASDLWTLLASVNTQCGANSVLPVSTPTALATAGYEVEHYAQMISGYFAKYAELAQRRLPRGQPARRKLAWWQNYCSVMAAAYAAAQSYISGAYTNASPIRAAFVSGANRIAARHTWVHSQLRLSSLNLHPFPTIEA